MKKIIFAFLLLLFCINCCFAKDMDGNKVEVLNYNELVEAIISGENEIIIDLKSDIMIEQLINIPSGKIVIINGNDYTLKRDSSYAGSYFYISAEASLVLEELVVDGGASGWKMDIDNSFYTSANNKGYVRLPTISDVNDVIATNSLIFNSGNLELNSVVLQNARSNVNGTAISGSGNNNIVNSTFKHIGSSKNGGAIYISGGETIVDGSIFEDNVAGVGVTTSQNGGAIYTSDAVFLDIKNNSIFLRNFAQGNGGAIFISNTSISAINTSFKENYVGNDGSAINLSSTSNNTAIFNDVLFDGNKGLAITGQSMGVVWISKWPSSDDNQIVARNIIAINNSSVTGLFSDSCDVKLTLEDSAIYNNNIRVGTAVYSQSGFYTIKNTSIYNNNSESHSGAVYLKLSTSRVNIEDSKIFNNNTIGTGIITVNGGGILNITNTEINNNKSKNGAIAIIGTYVDVPPVVTINNSLIFSNNALEYGGGLYIRDNEGIKSTLVLDETTKIYGNTAGLAGDDFVYISKDSGLGNNFVSLNDANNFNINGVDNWYHDNENSRYADIDVPIIYENNSETGLKLLYLKAAGEVELSYDLNGGLSSNEYEVEYTKYGSSFNVTDDKPSIENGEFIGWNTKPDGSGYWYYDTDTYKGEYGKVLYAQYRLKEPEVNPGTNSGDFIIVLGILIIASFTMLVLSTNSYVKLN